MLRESQELDEDESSDSSIDIVITDRGASKVSTERFHRQSSMDTLEEITRKHAMKQEHFERRKKKREEQDFLNQLRMFALLTPSMEFIPESKNFIKTMQQGLVQSFGSIKPGPKRRVGGRGAAQNTGRSQSGPAHNPKKSLRR